MANRSRSTSPSVAADRMAPMPKGARLAVDSGTKDSVSIAPSEYRGLVLALGKVVSNFARSPQTLDSQFEPALCDFVGALDIERSTIYLSGGKVYSWAKPGLNPVKIINSGDFPYTWKTIQEKGSFAYLSPEELPAAAAAERDYYRHNGPASLLVLPLIAAGTVFGGMAFEAITYNRSWPADLIQQLKLVADLFASGLVISQAKADVAIQLRFERCISDISASLVNLPAEQTDQRITEALRETGEALGLERMSFFKRSPIEEHFIRTHSWVKGGADAVPRQLLYDHALVLAKLLLAGQTLRYGFLSDMPAEAEQLRTYLEMHGIRSFMAMPISMGGRVVAGISIASAKQDPPWDTVLIRRLTLLGETLANAQVRHQQDEIVAAHQARLRLAMQASKSHGWDWNIETGSSVWFGDSKSIFGVSPDGPTRGLEDFLSYVHADDRDRLKGSLERAIRDHTPFEEEYRVVRTDGRLRWVSDRGSVFYGSDGSPKRMIGIAVDITDHKEVEAARIVAEARYGQLLESIEAIVWRADPESYQFTFVSRQAEEILGYPLAQWLESADFWADHIHPEDRDRVLEACDRDTEEGRDHVLEYRMIAADGRVVWLHDKVTVMTENASPVGLIGIMVDITVLKEAEERVRNLGGRLIEAQETERSRIARELHDDINQRIALVAIDLERLGKETLLSGREFRRHTRALWKKTSEITSQISRLCGQLHSSKLEHLGLVPAVRDLCDVMAERHSIRIAFSARSVPRQLRADLSLCLFRMCQESLANIVKHSACSRATVKLAVKRGSVEFIVTDNGRGFDPDARLGSGLGLISMRERASLLGGQFSVKAAPGSGTTVLARFPIPSTETTGRKGTGALL
jgi:PAS domain S-box-containing protein